MFEQCIESGTDGKRPIRNKADALERLGRYDEAIETLRQDTYGGRLTKSAESAIHRLERKLNAHRPPAGVPDCAPDESSLGSTRITGARPSTNSNGSESEPRQALPESARLCTAQITRLDKEKTLEGLLEESMQHGRSVFGKRLRVYESENAYGRQFSVPGVGRIDLLAQDVDTGDFVVIELKRGKSEDQVVGQILRYIGWVRENIAPPGTNVRGIICVGDASRTLLLSASSVDNLEVFVYDFNFRGLV